MDEVTLASAFKAYLTEMYLYRLLGKESARTLLALVSNLANAAGIPPARQRDLTREGS